MMMRGMTIKAAPATTTRRVQTCSSVVSCQHVARSARPGRRSTVVAQANLFARIQRLVMSTLNNLVYQAEDPEKLLDQVVNEMGEDLIKMRQAAARVMGSKKQLEAKYNASQGTADEWLRRAELAVAKGEDELAREALMRRKAFQDQASGLKVQLDMQVKAVDQLLGNTRVLESKIAEAKSKKDTLKARAASAKTSKQIQEMIGSLKTSNASVAFDKMEEKVLSMEAEAESTTLLVGGDQLEGKFALLESGTVEDELAALKKGLKVGKEKPGELPSGRPIEGVFVDAFDMELEELRKKARA